MLLLLLVTCVSSGGPEPPQQARFALIIGVNRSTEANLAPLRYADDDAARYFDLFRALGARTYLLSRPDDNTLRLHPQAASEAHLPSRDELKKVAGLLAQEATRARQRGMETILYLIYAGHGVLDNGTFYLGLEDGRLGGAELKTDLIDHIDPSRTHLIIDACNSFYLAYSRGPGGERRPAAGFAAAADILRSERVGLLLSTSSATESHEWEGFQAGVFSHEVRSGLYGAADVNQDGLVSYREIAAFVDHANRTVPNERYRPNVFAKPPLASGTLVDLRGTTMPELIINGDSGGRYLLEDAYGVRLLDFHNNLNQTVSIRRPPGGRYFLRRLGEDPVEYELESGHPRTAIAALQPEPPRSAGRGAAHQSFTRLFELPFDRQVVARFVFRENLGVTEIVAEPGGTLPLWREVTGWSSIGIALTATAAAIGLTLGANQIVNDAAANISHQEVAARNSQIRNHNVGSGSCFALAGVAALAGGLLLAWPSTDAAEMPVGVSGAQVTVRW